MGKAEAYKIETFSSTTKSEIKRLEAQVELFWDKEFEVYTQSGLKDGMSVLECGCGPGFLIERMATKLGSGKFAGLEIDPMLLAIFKGRIIEKGIGNIDFVQGSILDTGLPESAYDFVITRLVIEHLSDPNAALAEIKRVLKPGGKVIIVSNDFDYHLRTFPDIIELDDLYNAYCRARISEGGNPRIGRELPSRLKQEGYVEIDFDMICAQSLISGDELFLKSEGIGISSQLVKDGFLRSEVLDQIVQKWTVVLKTEGHAFVRPLFVAIGRKPFLGEEGKEKQLENKSRWRRIAQLDINDINTKTEDGANAIEKYLESSIAAAMNADIAAVVETENLDEVGFDSLMAVSLQEQIESDLCVHLSIADIFRDLTIKGIRDLLILELDKKATGTENSDLPLQSTTSGTDESNSSSSWEEGEI